MLMSYVERTHYILHFYLSYYHFHQLKLYNGQHWERENCLVLKSVRFWESTINENEKFPKILFEY